MKILIDSHVLLWWLIKPRALKTSALERLETRESELFVSAATWWELGIKRTLGRLRLDLDGLRNLLDQAEAQSLSITFAHAELASSLPPHHSDPFDRMLAAQTVAEGLILMTRDKAFTLYSVPIFPA